MKVLNAKLVLSSCTALAMTAPSVLAQPGPNRQASDAIFTEPRESAVPQLLYTLGDLIAFQVLRPKMPEATAIESADTKISTAINADLPEAQKIRLIHEAETDLARARLAALNSLHERGLLPSVIKYARVVGTTLVLADLAGRAYVWYALNANPTWSPAITMLTHMGESLSTKNALPKR